MLTFSWSLTEARFREHEQKLRCGACVVGQVQRLVGRFRTFRPALARECLCTELHKGPMRATTSCTGATSGCVGSYACVRPGSRNGCRPPHPVPACTLRTPAPRRQAAAREDVKLSQDPKAVELWG